jgi:hypothetical protein
MAMVYGVWDRLAKKLKLELKLEDRSMGGGREMWFWREESLAKENVAENGGKIWRSWREE